MSSTRYRLIQLLSDQADSYVSGQRLSEDLGISRNAVWKHMNELKKDGYVIDAKARKGYRIVDAPDKVSGNTISWGLNTKWLGKHIVHHDSVQSTQRIAHELALDEAAHGTVVVANEQVAGKGRMNRPWYSKAGKGIWMSLILRPEIAPYMAPQLTLLTATVLAEVLEQNADIQPQIKWPNDILINGKKTAGILTEMKAEQDQVLYVIIGVGININQTREDLPEELDDKATSLRIETGVESDLVPLIQKMLHKFEEKYSIYMKEGFQPVKSTWENYGFRLNEKLRIKAGTKEWHGVIHGIAEDGALLAETAEGEVEKLYSAEISWFQKER